jgi:hypothetical protein
VEPIAVGFMVLVGAAAFMGVVVGAIGGAVVWRLGSGLVLGVILTACTYVLVLIADYHEDFVFLRAKLIWGVPSMTVAFLLSSVLASWLEVRTTLRRNGVALAAFGLGLGLGFLYLLLFRIGMGAPLVAAPIVDIGLILLLIRNRRRLARGYE